MARKPCVDAPAQFAKGSQRELQMRHVLVLLLALIAAFASSLKASASESESESARELASDCQSLERGKTGAGAHIKIPNTKQALQCWGYMRAMQDLSVLADQDGHRIMGSCPPEQTTLLQLIHAFVTYARSNPGELQGNTALVVIKALGAAFPCHQVGGKFLHHRQRVIADAVARLQEPPLRLR